MMSNRESSGDAMAQLTDSSAYKRHLDREIELTEDGGAELPTNLCIEYSLGIQHSEDSRTRV